MGPSESLLAVAARAERSDLDDKYPSASGQQSITNLKGQDASEIFPRRNVGSYVVQKKCENVFFLPFNNLVMVDVRQNYV